MLSDSVIIDPTDIFGYLPDQPTVRIALINEPPPNKQCNILNISTSRYVWYATICEINQGEQLFTHYGDQYRRDYESTNDKLLSSSNLDCLKTLAKKYAWIREGIEVFFWGRD